MTNSKLSAAAVIIDDTARSREDAARKLRCYAGAARMDDAVEHVRSGQRVMRVACRVMMENLTVVSALTNDVAMAPGE